MFQGWNLLTSLGPSYYNFDPKAYEAALKISSKRPEEDKRQQQSASEKESMDAKSKILYTGFVAQEVEEAAKKLEYDFSGVDAPKNEKDYYGLRYSEFVVPLVKAVQQLSAKNDSLQQRLEKLEMLLGASPSNLTLINGSIAQNSPNPFKGNTTVSYNLPQQGVGNAQIVVYDVAGKRLRMFNLPSQSRGTVHIDAILYYRRALTSISLFINGKMIDTKKMVLIK